MQVTVYQKKKLRKSSYPSPPTLLTDEQLPYSTKHVKIWLFSVVVKCLSPLNNFCNFSKNVDFQVCLLGIFFNHNYYTCTGFIGKLIIMLLLEGRVFIAFGKAIALAYSNSPLILSAHHSALPWTIFGGSTQLLFENYSLK